MHTFKWWICDELLDFSKDYENVLKRETEFQIAFFDKIQIAVDSVDVGIYGGHRESCFDGWRNSVEYTKLK